MHGTALAARAEALGLALAFEAAVAGGIPIIKALREGLAGNRLERVYGILNGTSNYILTTMRESGREFAEVLAEAQKLGYAEADPSFDIDGVDAAHKLAILASVALRPPGRSRRRLCRGHPPRLAARHRFCRGARLPHQAARHRPADRSRPRAARPPLHGAAGDADRGGRGRLQRGRRRGRFRRPGRAAKGAAPAPSRPPRRSPPISSISPPGAGSRRSACRPASLRALPGAPMERHQGAYYIRLMVVDQPGVIADVAAALARRAGVDGIDDPARPRAGRGGAGGADDPCHGRGGDAPRARRQSKRSTPCSSRRG